MASEAQYMVVALTAVATLMAVVALGISLGSKVKRFSRHYKIYFARQSLEGLTEGGEVRLLGTRVGIVTRLRPSTWRQGAVEAFVRIDKGTQVYQNTLAIVERHAATGLASIALVNPAAQSSLLTEATRPEAYPLINEG